jgi:ABC transporter substrate binding protein (PQQ-dependent alcohol dehydrogenase system)
MEYWLMISRIAAVVGLIVYPLIIFSANAEEIEIPIYYFMLEDDPFYKEQRTYAGLQLKQPQRALDGVKVGLRESRVLGRALHVKFKLEEIVLTGTDSTKELEKQVAVNQPRFIIADLPKEYLKSLSDIVGHNDAVIFNPRLYDDDLRQHACAKNIFHTLPSYAMLYDALAQYLKKKDWQKVLLLEGPQDEDKKIADAFVRSAKKMGLKIVDRRLFVLSNNPRDRSETNIPILTSGPKYDAVFVADSYGEFARYVTYH